MCCLCAEKPGRKADDTCSMAPAGRSGKDNSGRPADVPIRDRAFLRDFSGKAAGRSSLSPFFLKEKERGCSMRDGRKCRRVQWSDFDLPDEQEKSGMRSVFFVPACAQFLCRSEERAYGPRGAQVMGACRSCLENGLSVSPHPVSGGGLFTAGDSGRYSLNDQPVPPREDAQRVLEAIASEYTERRSSQGRRRKMHIVDGGKSWCSVNGGENALHPGPER